MFCETIYDVEIVPVYFAFDVSQILQVRVRSLDR